MRPSPARLLRRFGRSRAAHRVTIDGGIGERRQRQRRGDVARQHAPVGVAKRDGLDVLTALTRAAMMPRPHRPTSSVRRRQNNRRTIAPWPRQGSLRCAQARPSTGIADRLHHSGDGRRCHRDGRPAAWFQPQLAGDADDAGILGNSSGLPLAARCTSILRCGSRLKPSTITRSTARHLCRAVPAAAARRRRAVRASAPSACPRTPALRPRRPRGARQESLPGTSTSKL